MILWVAAPGHGSKDDANRRPVFPFERDTKHDPAWSRFYGTTSKQPSLSITQTTDTNPHDALTSTQISGHKVAVNGHPGDLDDNGPDNRTVIWSDGTYTFVINTADPHVTNAQLLEIASHLA
ncbi:hypothetical protein A6P39_001950 [Streptomyces sp. FXJ1.172]|uniref:hypothetical protein n=1 Tax=Streptomyces sp. FXJ1.172 TaxID=710705 RepID=UPI0007D012F2|nr:hypothetical protein [Streptomyces sp. FXJ1.172]WEO92950.1 hypothetical protein A6P39_001950 [Streptomyces sp. FXJ1.172]